MCDSATVTIVVVGALTDQDRDELRAAVGGALTAMLARDPNRKILSAMRTATGDIGLGGPHD